MVSRLRPVARASGRGRRTAGEHRPYLQEFRLSKDGFGLRGSRPFSLRVQDRVLPLDEAEASSWQNFLSNGISKLKTARDNWERRSASPHYEFTNREAQL
jgi:hypothetical protein